MLLIIPPPSSLPPQRARGRGRPVVVGAGNVGRVWISQPVRVRILKRHKRPWECAGESHFDGADFARSGEWL
jgi:hypothetical protein